MNDRIIPGVLAIGLGSLLVLAVLVAVPVYGLALLGCTPLPLSQVDDAFCAGRTAADALQTRPFAFVGDIARIAARQDATGARAWLANAAVQQVVLNVVLFAPLGWFLRGVFRRSLPVTVLAGFAVSLLVEATRYTGDWFLFPCAYRLADVDDLIANTAGALLGGLAATLLRPRSWDAGGDPGRPAPVTAGRRLLGALCDLTAVWVTGAVLGALLLAVATLTGYTRGPLPGWFDTANTVVGSVLPLLVFLVVPLAGRGGTVGQRAVRLRPARPDGGVPGRGRRLARVLLGTGGFLVLSAPSGGLGVLALLWGPAGLVGLWRTAGHTGVAGRLTGLAVVDDRAGAGARPVAPAR